MARAKRRSNAHERMRELGPRSACPLFVLEAVRA